MDPSGRLPLFGGGDGGWRWGFGADGNAGWDLGGDWSWAPDGLRNGGGLAGRNCGHCLGQALGKNGVALALDAAGVGAGFLPGGAAIVAVAQIGVGAASTVNSAMSAGKPGEEGRLALGGAISSIFGMQLSALAPIAKDFGVGAKAVPGLGSILSAGGVLGDLWQTYRDYEACMGAH